MTLRLAALFALILSAAPQGACADEASISISALQSLGGQIKLAADRIDLGAPPSSIEIASLDHQLSLIRSSIATTTDQRIVSKYRAIALLFEKLNSDIAHSPMSSPRTVALERSQVDVETVTPSHGATCATALGLTLDRPVRLALGSADDAWLLIADSVDSTLRFKTVSSGPDPVIDVVDGCGANPRSLASSDDSLGLDADAIVVNTRSRPLYVHLTNSGQPGFISIAATVAPGSINGTVNDINTGAPVSNASILAYANSGFFYGSGYTDQYGVYSFVPSQPGTYYVIASAQFYVTEPYPTGSCPINSYYYNFAACDFSKAQTVTVTATSSVSDINFSLSMGEQMTGQVRGSDNLPLASQIYLLSQSGQQLAEMNSDGGGHFTFQTLPPGSYVVEATASGYGSQMYDHVPCSGPLQLQCNTLAANAIVVGTQNLADINFTLPKLSSIVGTVTTSDGAPLNGGYVTVLDQNGNGAAGGSIDSFGHYSAGPLANGTFYVFAGSSTTFSQLYANHDCATTCAAEIANATPINVTYAGQNVEADFVLDYLPTLNGHVTDAITGLPLRNTEILLSTQSPNISGYSSVYAYTDASGAYSVPYVPPGQYFVWAQSVDHVDQIYNGIVCEAVYYYSPVSCNVSGATLLSVVPTQTTLPSVDFALNPSVGISGHATIKAGAGSDLPALTTINLYDGTGATVGTSSTDATGYYVISDLAPGTYYALAQPLYYGNLISQIWQNIDCNNCVATSGTPIVVAQGQTASGIDFNLTRTDAVVGRVVDDAGHPLQGVVIDIFSTFDGSYVTSAGTDAQGYYEVPATLGATYYVATESGSGYIDQVYSGISCTAGTAYDKKCSFTGALPVNVGNGATQPHIVNFVLQSNDPIFANGFE